MATNPPIRLGVNIDHVATVRNARGGRHPDPVKAAEIAIAAGADGITRILREDRRHIVDDDIARLKERITKPLNLEMAATAEMAAIARRCVQSPPPASFPRSGRSERTEGGLDAAGQRQSLRAVVGGLTEAGIRVSLSCRRAGADRGRRPRSVLRSSSFTPAPGATHWRRQRRRGRGRSSSASFAARRSPPAPALKFMPVTVSISLPRKDSFAV